MSFMEFMSWAAFALLAAGLFVGVLIQVEERLERRRRVSRSLRTIGRYGSKSQAPRLPGPSVPHDFLSLSGRSVTKRRLP